MEFRFNLQPIFPQHIVRVNSNLLPHTFRGDRRTALDTTSKISEIINTMGELSAKAQGLTKPVTTAQKLRMSDQNIYLLGDPEEGKNGAVIGYLKVGKKSLYVFDENGETKMVNAPCVLDFYVHETRQRAGLGKNLFETMLQEENFIPEKMAVDRPSDKLIGFLRKHYGLQKTIPQMNNFVVYEGFFDRPATNNNQDDAGVHITDSPNTALFGPQYTNDDKRRSKPQQKSSAGSIPQIQSSPVGRYAAPRPMCSMAECLRSEDVPRAVRGDSKTSVQSRLATQNVSDVLNQKNQEHSNASAKTNVNLEQVNANECSVDKQKEIPHNCHVCSCSSQVINTGGCIIPVPPTADQPAIQNETLPSHIDNVVCFNNIPTEAKQNKQSLLDNQKPEEVSSRILIKKKLAQKRSGLQGTTMDNFCASNTSIQTSGMDNPPPLGLESENVNLISPINHANRVATATAPNQSSAVETKANESQSGLQTTHSLNPCEPVEQNQLNRSERKTDFVPNNTEAMNIEEFQEICPKCSTAFISSRASLTKTANTLQVKPSQTSQKNVHQTNDTIIHSSATPATGEPNREL